MITHVEWPDIAQTCTNTVHPTWDQAAINFHSRFYDKRADWERRKYLMRLTDAAATTLPKADQYDRLCYLSWYSGMQDVTCFNASRSLDTYTSYPHKGDREKTSPKSFKEVYKGFK